MAGQRLGFYFDADRCIGCKSCESACRAWNGLELGVRWRQVVRRLVGKFPELSEINLSIACNNCEAAPCLKACPTAALHRDPELGHVDLDQQKCIGCRYCEWACPYGAIQHHPEKKKVSKCTLCSDRLRGGIAPACVASCPHRLPSVWRSRSTVRKASEREARLPRVAQVRACTAEPAVRAAPEAGYVTRSRSRSRLQTRPGNRASNGANTAQ